MSTETALSEAATRLEEALSSLPPKYDVADEIFAKHQLAAEELSMIAINLMDMCYEEQFEYGTRLDYLIEDHTLCSNIYQVMQYLFRNGYEPNVDTESGRAIEIIQYLSYPEGLAPRLMRLFLEKGADSNYSVGGATLLEIITQAIDYNEYMHKDVVNCWLVLMAYGARIGDEKCLPIVMHGDYDVTIFKRFEDYSYEIIPTLSDPQGFGAWIMRIYETCDEYRKLVASYGDLERKTLERIPSEKVELSKETCRRDCVPISEEDFLGKIAKMYSECVEEDISHHMESDFRYSSFWVFEEIESAKAYVDYIKGKVQAIKKAKAVVKTKMMHIKGSGKPCLVIEQQSGAEPACLTVERSKNGLIAKMSMMPSSFYELAQ